RSVKRGGEALNDAEQHRADHGSGKAAEPAEYADREDPADIFTSNRWLDRLDDDEQRTGDGGRRDGNPQRDALDADPRSAHQPQRQRILRNGGDCASDERIREIKLERGKQDERSDARHQHPQWKVDHADAPARPDISCFDIAVVDAKHQNEHHLGDEEQAEEERQAAQRLLPAPPKGFGVDMIDAGAEKIKDRQHDDADRDRIDAEAGVDDVGDVGAEDDEGGMRDVDDVEDAERNRYADCDRRIKSTEQD